MSYVVHQTGRRGGKNDRVALFTPGPFCFLLFVFFACTASFYSSQIAVGISAASVGPAVLCVLSRPDGVDLAEGRK